MNDDSTNPDQPTGQQIPQTALNRAPGLTHGARIIQPLAHVDPPPPTPVGTELPQQLPASATESVAPTRDVAALYPAVPDNRVSPADLSAGQTFVTGSQMHTERPKLPWGVYVIAGLNVVSFVAVFLDDYHAGTWYTIAMLLNLVFAIGLLLRQDIIRKLYIVLSVLSIVVVILAFIGIANTRGKLNTLRANYDATISRMDTANLTAEQQMQMQIMPQLLDEIQKKNEELFRLAYIRLGAEAVIAVVCVVYLMRPKVKAAFIPVEA